MECMADRRSPLLELPQALPPSTCVLQSSSWGGALSRQPRGQLPVWGPLNNAVVSRQRGISALNWSNRRKRIIRRFVIGTLGLLLVSLIASWFVGGWLVAPQPCVIGEAPTDLPATSISLVSDSGGAVAGWHVPSRSPQGVVVLLHPLRGSRLFMLQRARFLHAAGYSIVMIDLHAHGETPGKQITLGHLEKHDVRAAVEFARQEHPGEPIGVVGVSLGGASALLASPLEIDALVLESVYPTIHDAVHNRVAAQLGPFSTIPAELLLAQLRPRFGVWPSQLRPIDHLATVGCPVFLLSGVEDRHTTTAETEQMFAVACQPKELWLVDGAAHVDLHGVSPEKYKTRVVGFLNQHLRTQD